MPDTPQSNEAVRLFYSYSHKDEGLRDTLQEHLALLRRQGVISEWHDRGIGAGREWAGEIDEHLKSADVILLLVSSSFIASDYCYDIELKLAMERHEAKEARVIPVILRPCKWEKAPFGKLNALPKNAKPVTKWSNRDDAFTDIANGIGLVAEELKAERQASATPAAVSPDGAAAENVTTPPESKSVSSLIPRPPVVGFVSRRDKEGRDIVELLKGELSPDKNQLVALWGPGGAGKTTLAVELINETKDSFRGRVVWASSLNRSDFTLATLLDEISTQLGREDMRRLAPEPKAAQVASLVTQSPTLVILDNFETIAEEEQTRCLDFLAQGAACPVLITTRAFVDRDDVTNVELAAMEMDEAREFLRRLVRRTPKKQNFAGIDHDDLIKKCEANPLLLQWVVRQIVLSKAPQTALDYLSKGEGDAAERVFTRSFNLPQLGDDGRAALLALSLFIPNASREALAEVSGFGNDLRRLDKAVESLSSLWLVETTEGNDRLILRGLTRELAKSRLSNGASVGEFQRRYVTHFRSYAETHPNSTPKDFDALEVEKDNLIGAIDVAARVKDLDSAMVIRGTINRFLYLRGYLDEAIRSGEQAVAAARDANNDWYAAYFTMCVAAVIAFRGEYEEAKKLYEDALGRLRVVGDDRNVTACLHQLGMIAHHQGDLEEAHRLYSESLEIKRGLGNESGVADTLHQLGNIAYSLNNTEEARRLYTECLEIGKGIGDEIIISIALTSLGLLEYNEGNNGDARKFYSQSLDISERLGDQNSIAITSYNLGIVAEVEGDRIEAARLYRRALDIFDKLGSPKAEETRRVLARLED